MALSVIDYVLFALAGFLILRFLAAKWLRRLAERRAFYQEYVDVLNLPQYKVKSQYEDQ